MSEASPVSVTRVITRLNVGGPSHNAILLSKGLSARGFDTTLISGTVTSREGRIDPAGVHHVSLPALKRALDPLADISAFRSLKRHFSLSRPAIVHTHLAKAGTLGRIAARSADIPHVVHTFHGHVLEGYFSRPASAGFLQIERALARRTDALVAVSQSIRDELLDLGVGTPTQWHVIPLGLDLEPIADSAINSLQARRVLDLPRSGPIVGIVGRLVPIKNHELFLEAARLISGERPDTCFVIAGDGELRDRLESRGRALLGDRVRFLGWVHDLPGLYRALDVAVLSSNNEGTPVALIEAAAAATPIVATDVGGVKDVIDHGHTGYVVPPNDAASLAARVTELLNDARGAHRMGTQARGRAITRFGARRSLDEVAHLYDSLLSARRHASQDEVMASPGEAKLHVAVLLPDLRTGGAERLLVDFVRILKERESLVTLHVLGLRDGPIREELEELGCAVKVLRSRRRFDPAAIGRAIAELRRIQPALIHAHLPRAGVLGRLAAIHSRIPIIYTEHSLWEQHHPLSRVFNRLTFRLNTAVIAVSEAIKVSIVDQIRFPPDRIITIRNGIAPHSARVDRGEAAARMDVPGDSCIVGCVANLRTKKGHRYLLEALARVDVDPAPYCVMVGRDQGAEAELKSLARRLGIEDRCRFLGYRKDARSLLGAFDIFVLPSLLEGLPVAILEAMDAGRAVIATPVGGVSEAIIHGKTGLLVDPGDSAQLTSALELLMQDAELRDRLGRAAKKRIQDEFSADAMVDRHLELYESLVKR